MYRLPNGLRESRRFHVVDKRNGALGARGLVKLGRRPHFDAGRHKGELQILLQDGEQLRKPRAHRSLHNWVVLIGRDVASDRKAKFDHVFDSCAR